MIKNISDLKSKYDYVSYIGRGGEGKVLKVKSKENNAKYYAVKELETDLKSPEEEESFFKQIDILKNVNHPAIVPYIGFTIRHNLETELKNHPALIFEYMPYNLEKCIKDDRLTMPNIYIILIGIAEGMKYLHSIHVVHRDLKPSNILLDSDLYPYIGDLGFAKYVNGLTQKELESYKGTPMYTAPEIPEGKYNSTCDIYSYAILFYQLFTKQVPYKDTANIFTFFGKLNGEPPMRPDLEIIQQKEIKDFLNKCWSNDTTERIPFDRIVEKLKTTEFRKIFGVTDDEFAKYMLKFNEKIESNDSRCSLIVECVDIFKQQLFEAKDVNELFHLACMMGNVELVKYLLSDKLINVNAYKIPTKIFYTIQIEII